MMKNILSIAGSDPSGGAGLQGDLKAFAALGAYGMAVPTALTAQNTRGVSGVHHVPADFVAEQLRMVFEDVRVDAVKIGMAGSPECIRAVADVLTTYTPAHIVLDPVMVASSGADLSSDQSVRSIIQYLLPISSVITPNIPEAEVLLGRAFDGDMERFARDILALGTCAVYLKGGHLDCDVARDIYLDENGLITLDAPRVQTKNTHGTGCALSSALAVFLARGLSGAESARQAKSYITNAITCADDLDVGQGAGPVHHGWAHKG